MAVKVFEPWMGCLCLCQIRLNSGEPVALFKNQTIRLAVLTLAVFKVVSTVAIAGAIPPELAPILSRLGLTAQELLQQVWKFSSSADNQSVPLAEPPPVSISISQPVVV